MNQSSTGKSSIVNRQSSIDDTVAAISTPLGEAGLAVIRLSGPAALPIAERCFRPLGKQSLKPSVAPSHTLHYGRIIRNGQVIDEVMLAVLRAPRTFTREDMVEISCHGGIVASKLVLASVLEEGARLAEPGEFTKRAFLNGRIDLAQAEAVADLIHSRTELALAAAQEQLAGKLSHRINAVRDDLMNLLAHLEAHIDFPEEDIAPDTLARLLERLIQARQVIDELLRHADEGQILRRGLRAAIIGRPNAGKSSLLNRLLGQDRAIVSATPGTTRDTISETANIRGIPVVFIDTAGLREANDQIEEEGVRRSRSALAQSDLVLHVLDGSEPLHAEDARTRAEFAGKKRLLIRNKIDRPQRLNIPPDWTEPVVDVSCLTGVGLESVKTAIEKMVWAGEIRSEMLPAMMNARHQNALQRARAGLERSRAALAAGQTPELAALDLRIAVQAVGEIVGKTATDDLLDSIFSQFCIGK